MLEMMGFSWFVSIDCMVFILPHSHKKGIISQLFQYERIITFFFEIIKIIMLCVWQGGFGYENFDWKSLKCLVFEIVHFAKFGYGKVSIQKATILKACDPWFLISFRNHRSMAKLGFTCTCLSKKN
jgi:hypothetical protein